MAERVIPHSDEAERSVLGASMLDERALIEVAEKIKPEDFYKKNHQEIFAAMMQLHRQNAPVDSLTVSEELIIHNRPKFKWILHIAKFFVAKFFAKI